MIPSTLAPEEEIGKWQALPPLAPLLVQKPLFSTLMFSSLSDRRREHCRVPSQPCLTHPSEHPFSSVFLPSSFLHHYPYEEQTLKQPHFATPYPVDTTSLVSIGFNWL